MVHMPACQANAGWLFVSIAIGMSHGAPQVTWRRGRGCGKLMPVRPAVLFLGGWVSCSGQGGTLCDLASDWGKGLA